MPRLQGALRREVRSWCAAQRPVAVYQAAKALTFRMAARILLGLQLEEARCTELAQTFEQLVENLFSLPLDVPFSGLRKVMPPQTLAQGSRSSPKPEGIPLDPGVAQCAIGCLLVGTRTASLRTLCVTPGQATHPLWDAPDSHPRVSVAFLSLDLSGRHPGRQAVCPFSKWCSQATFPTPFGRLALRSARELEAADEVERRL